MKQTKLNQEKNIGLNGILSNLSNLALFIFDTTGKVSYVNEPGADIIGINAEEDLESINIKKIFDFRISEILNELEKNSEVLKDINIINANESAMPTRTCFRKYEGQILAVSTVLAKQDRSIITKKLVLSLGKISNILNTNLELDDILELILDDLRSLTSYDRAIIMFIEGDNLSVKASRNIIDSIHKEYKKNLDGGANLLNKLIKHHMTLVDNVANPTANIPILELMKSLGLKINMAFSYIATPLIIRETLFGVIILIKEQENYFLNEDVKIIETFASSASYSVKDAELSNVFKMQLKILKENVMERTKALEVIKEQNLKILEADKMKNEFIANISHELRTPLNAIIGFSEALKLKIFGDLNEKQEEYIDDIHTSGIHLLGMINDLLDLSKIEAKEMQIYKKTFKVFSAVTEAINIITAIADKKGITIETFWEDKDIEIFADRRKFQQILYNLLSNATKFSHEGGKIDIGIGKEDECLKVYVKDYGIGIEPKFHEKIFFKFQQVDNSYARRQGSTGLGLTITKELVEMHDGKIWVESNLNIGSAFYFTIPIIECD